MIKHDSQVCPKCNGTDDTLFETPSACECQVQSWSESWMKTENGGNLFHFGNAGGSGGSSHVSIGQNTWQAVQPPFSVHHDETTEQISKILNDGFRPHGFLFNVFWIDDHSLRIDLWDLRNKIHQAFWLFTKPIDVRDVVERASELFLQVTEHSVS